MELESTFRLKKTTFYSETWESYETKLKAFYENEQATCTPLEADSDPNCFSKAKPQESGSSLKLKYNNKSLEIKDGAQEIKKSTVLVWITEETQIKFSEILPIIASISAGNKVLSEAMKYFETPQLSSLFSKGFITKIQIPVAFSIRANIFFQNLEFIQEDTRRNYSEHFEIPKAYKHLSRKQAQKTIQRVKKLVLIGQALI